MKWIPGEARDMRQKSWHPRLWEGIPDNQLYPDPAENFKNITFTLPY